ncbi:hypothetical protein Q7P37_005371 [Cladosporium fusiforme]
MADDSNTTSFNPGETKIILAIMQNLTSDIQFDVEKVATELGYKDAGSFRARWNSIKRSKITGAVAATGSPARGVTKSTPTKKAKGTPKSSGKKSKVAVKEEAEDEDGEGEVDGAASPKVKAKEGRQATVEDAEDSGGAPKVKAKRGRKPKVKTEEVEEPQDVVDTVEGEDGVAAVGDQEDSEGKNE